MLLLIVIPLGTNGCGIALYGHGH